ncbi:PH domain-containing protein [Actinokineospora inagensis]|uniref:PH domain-containing protein n=1 Tax=Actinokineospora inagensis TaxID=103730 RepID=UPI0003F939D7|nr:PH domain-containing protein [Actinokineospora inagensis]
MAYPDDVLSEGEQVVLHKHPHWKMLLLPYLILLVVLAGGIWLAVLAQDLSWHNIAYIVLGAVALVILGWGFLVPFVRWRTTHFIITTDRVMFRMGVVKRTGIDIPLARISSVRFEHGLIDRIVGCGTLIVESSSQEPLEFDDIPNVEKVHTLLYREVNDNPYDDFGREERPHGDHPERGRR